MKTIKKTFLVNRQTGIATLTTAVILLFSMTLIIIYSSRTGVLELKIAANDVRAKEAFANSEKAIEIGSSYLKANSDDIMGWAWVTCDAVADSTQPPCGNGNVGVYNSGGQLGYAAGEWSAFAPINTTAYSVGFLAKDPSSAYLPITIVGSGASADNTASAITHKTLNKYSILNMGPVPPVMAPSVSIGGTMTVVSKPHTNTSEGYCDGTAGGDGNPIAILSANAPAFPGAGTMQSCYTGQFRDGADAAPASAICTEPGVADEYLNTPTWNQCICQEFISDGYDPTDADSVANMRYSDPDAPSTGAEVFAAVFGDTTWQAMKGLADSIVDDCSTLDTSSNGLIWIEGDCSIGNDISSRTDPVVMVIEGDVDIHAQHHIWGIIYIIDQAGVSNTASDASLTGGVTIHGAFIAETALDLGAGSTIIMYDKEVTCGMVADGSSKFDRFGDIAGSWNDRLYQD